MSQHSIETADMLTGEAAFDQWGFVKLKSPYRKKNLSRNFEETVYSRVELPIPEPNYVARSALVELVTLVITLDDALTNLDKECNKAESRHDASVRQHRDLERQHRDLEQHLADVKKRAERAEKRVRKLTSEIEAMRRNKPASPANKIQRLKRHLLQIIRKFHPDKASKSALSCMEVTAELNVLLETIGKVEAQD